MLILVGAGSSRPHNKWDLIYVKTDEYMELLQQKMHVWLWAIMGRTTPPLRGNLHSPTIDHRVCYGRENATYSPNFIIHISYWMLILVGAGSSRPHSKWDLTYVKTDEYMELLQQKMHVWLWAITGGTTPPLQGNHLTYSGPEGWWVFWTISIKLLPSLGLLSNTPVFFSA